MRRPLIVGNWKMNGTSESLNVLIQVAGACRSVASAVDTAICPPHTLLYRASTLCANEPLAIGAQDCHAKDRGAYTGDVSPLMLRDAGARLVIVGHSERRSGHRESNRMVRAKASAALTEGMLVILCVGESLKAREAGNAEEVIARQVRNSIPDAATAATLVIAYEPIWAIGTGVRAKLADIVAMHAVIRETAGRYVDPADLRLLYGGSVTGDNVSEVLAGEGIDGALVGGASLQADSFIQIIRAAHEITRTRA